MRMELCHPPIAPWCQRRAEACDISLLTQGIAPDARVFLRAEPDNEELLIPMQFVATEGSWLRWRAMLPWDEGNVHSVYAFKVLSATGQLWLSAQGVHAHLPLREQMFKVSKTNVPPDWVAGQVFYQIFPDRFHASPQQQASLQTGQYLYGAAQTPVRRKPWGAPVDQQHAASCFFGGDLPGIVEKLPYLAKLGVTALYLNPIFSSGSNHKYDTEDYNTVDAYLGGNAALCELRAATKARGMRLILDAVLNHTSDNHPWFNRRGQHAEPGAMQSEASPWRNWYCIHKDGSYASWKGHESLPVLDFVNPAVQHEIYAGDQAVLRRWLRPPFSIDGWRLDVIHMLGEGPGAKHNARYVRAFRQAIKAENPEAYMLGEHFSEASRWLQGEQEDGAMNYYGFAQPVRAWLAKQDINAHPITLSTEDFAQWLTQCIARIPYENQLAQMNLLDSHDTPRFFSLLDKNLPLMKLAVTLLMAHPGVPCVYYGDEIGLEGGADPDCRRCFEWDEHKWNQALWSHYQRMIALRKSRPEWQRGAWKVLYAQGETFVFARFNVQATSIFAINRGEKAVSLALNVSDLPHTQSTYTWRNIAGEAWTPGQLNIAPLSACILLSEGG